MANSKMIKITYVPQNNYLMNELTVYEAMLYGCMLQNSTTNRVNHKEMVNKSIASFGIEKIRDTRIGRCSGGQQKRVSIALELFGNPNVLILDEPTTGLDSPSCAAVVSLLVQLAKNRANPMLVLATIHQPAWNIFNKFDQTFILTKYGRALYSGREWFSENDLR